MTSSVELLLSLRESSEETYSEEVFGDKCSFKSKQCGGKYYLISNGVSEQEYLEDLNTSAIQLVFLKIIDPDTASKSLKIQVDNVANDIEVVDKVWIKGGVEITSIFITNDCGNEVKFYLYAVGAPVTA